jgi:hypothetical protein
MFANTTKGHALANIETVRNLAAEYDLTLMNPASPQTSEQRRLL